MKLIQQQNEWLHSRAVIRVEGLSEVAVGGRFEAADGGAPKRQVVGKQGIII